MTRRRLLVGLVLCAGLALFGHGSYMRGKAWLAQALIARSWIENRAQGSAAVKPWPWADIRAVAKLHMPAHNITQYIMNDASGEALAFGAGMLPEGVMPADEGHSVIAGHRDSHFAFLQNVAPGDEIVVENVRGQTRHYRITRHYILDTRQESALPLRKHHALTLITCYPFNTLFTNGPLRYVVEAIAVW